MASPFSPPLFVLPCELRMKIYAELLCPDPLRLYTLYHDRQGRDPSFNLHPNILSVCKQAHDEATSLLYCNNIFEIYIATTVVRQCTGGIYPDSIPDPPPLLREDDALMVQSVSARCSLPVRNSTRAGASCIELGSPGMIFLHCLRRMRHIRLVTSRGAIWGQTRRGEVFSSPGKLLLRILQDLAGEAPMTPRKSLDLVVHPDWWTKYGIFQPGNTDAKDRKEAVEMLALLQKIQRTRAMILEEKIFSNELGRLETKLVDIDGVLASLAGHLPVPDKTA